MTSSTNETLSQMEKFIELIKERSLLYDVNDVRYKLRSKRLNAWKEITREMGSGNVNVWTAKWKGLKDNYAKHKKAIAPHNDINHKKYKHWPWAEHMKFFDTYFTNVSSKNIMCAGTQRDDTPAKTQTIAQLYLPDNDDANSSLQDLNEPEVDMFDNKRKIQDRNDSTEVPETSKKKKYDNKDEMDGVDHFFLSYAQSFKQLPNRMQIMLKLEIATLFSRYELQADGVPTDVIENIPRIVPVPVKSEYEFTYTE